MNTVHTYPMVTSYPTDFFSVFFGTRIQATWAVLCTHICLCVNKMTAVYRCEVGLKAAIMYSVINNHNSAL